jgi:hypothetical protein
MRAIELMFGVRSDLDLNVRWWHRLAKVAFTVVSILLSAAAFLLAWGSIGTPNTNSVVVLTDLRRFGDGRADGNYVSAFIESPGELGRVDYGGWISSPPLEEVRRIECDPKNKRYKPDPNAPRIDPSFKPFEPSEIIGRTVPDRPGGDILTANCTIPLPSSLESLKSADQIIKYRVPWNDRLQPYAIAALVVLAWLWLATNLYWRGLIYIAFGPRKRGAGDIDTQPPLSLGA